MNKRLKEILKKIYLKKNIIKFRMNSQKAFDKFINVLEENKINVWLDYGTLLGAYREKDFIKHDTDIDFGIDYSEEILKKIAYSMELNNIKKIRELSVDERIVEQTYRCNNVNIDIFYYIKNNNMRYTYCYEILKKDAWKSNNEKEEYKFNKNIKLYCIEVPNDEIGKIEFKNHICNCPKNVEKYLEINYGKNFMEKNKKWNYVSSPPNMSVYETQNKEVRVYKK